MIPVRRISNPTLDTVAQNRSATKVRHVDPQFIIEPVLDQMVVQIRVSHAGLDQAARIPHVDVQHPIHIPPHVQPHTSRHPRRRPAVPDVAPRAEGPHGDRELVAQPHHRLHLGHLARRHDRRCHEVVLVEDVEHVVRLGRVEVRRLGQRGVLIVVAAAAVAGDDSYVFGADDGGGALDVGVEVRRVGARRKHERLRRRH